MNMNLKIISKNQSKQSVGHEKFSFFSNANCRSRRPPSAPINSSWAGRVTKPQPFCLTNSSKMDKIHRTKCVHQLQEEKIQKEIEDEMMLNRSFKGKIQKKYSI